MLLNEVKQQQAKLAAQAKQLGELKQQLSELKALAAALSPQAGDKQMAMR
jgi:hypothetical protein